MIDEAFINQTLQKGREAKEKVQRAFSNISTAQLNWKPAAESWSIAQCLDHLHLSHSKYFSDLEKIISNDYHMSFWERYSPFTTICGRLMKDRLKEVVKKKMKAPQKIKPHVSSMPLTIINDYLKSLDKFLEYISACRNIDIDKTIITSPIIRIVTYSLRDGFEFLIQHEHRHINQAIRVKESEGFPKN